MTLALTAGVPMEVVKKVTGHRTADIVMKHYFQPGREDFRRTLAAKLPPLLGGGQPPPRRVEAEELRSKLHAMTAGNWRQLRDEILQGLGEAIDSPALIEVVAVPS